MGLFDMGGGGGNIPAPPDPKKLIKKQTAANDRAFNQGLINTQGSFGSTGYAKGPDGRVTQNTNLAPGQQAIFNPAQGAAANYAGQLPSAPFSMNDVPQGMDLAGAFYNQQLGLMQPGFDDQNRDLEVRAAERGLPIGSQAYNALMDPAARGQALAKQQASQQAVLMTPQEQQRQLANALTVRGLPFQEAMGALGIQNTVQQPQAMNPLGAPQAPNVAGIMNQGYQNQMAQYAARQAQQAQQNAQMNSLLGAAGSLGGYMIGGPVGGAVGGNLPMLF